MRPRNKLAEWRILNRYFGSTFVETMFSSYSGYEEVRQENDFQTIFNELNNL